MQSIQAPPQTKIPLHDYQIYAKDFILTHNYCGLFMIMGTGKTAVTLEAIWELNPSCHVLIIAPKTIARSTWISEIRKWKMNLRTQSLIVNERGKPLSKKKREELYDKIPQTPPTVYFINRDMIVNLIKYTQSHNMQWPFPMVIIDESQSFKSHSSERFKHMQTIRPYIWRLVELTGSPTPNGLMDLWAQIWLLDMGQRLGKNITAYRNTWFTPGIMINNYPVTWYPRPYAEQNIYDRIRDIVISMKNVSLPPVTFNDVIAYMEPDEYKRYKDFKRTNILDLLDGTQIEAANAAVLQAKLSQMASGAIYTKTGSHEFEVIHEHKLELCEYIVNNTDSPVIIAYHFQSDKQMLLDYFKKAKLPIEPFDGSPEMIDRWNARQIPVMLLQPASGGFGLNLQQGGHTLIWYTIPWSLEQYEQTNARLHRQGQTEPVIIHHLLTDKTIDAGILAALKEKDNAQQTLIDAVQAVLYDEEE